MSPIQKSRKDKVYVDTDVLINVFKEEKDRSKNSTAFFYVCLSKSSKTILLTSDLLYREAFGVSKDQQLNISEDNVLYRLLRDDSKIVKIQASKEQIELAKKFGGQNWKDLLHYMLAKQLDADYLVSNNIPHMRHVKQIYADRINEYKKEIKILKPREYLEIIEKEVV